MAEIKQRGEMRSIGIEGRIGLIEGRQGRSSGIDGGGSRRRSSVVFGETMKMICVLGF